MPPQHRKIILIVDATNTFFRGYMSNPCISNNGEHVGGIVSFLSTLRDFVAQHAIDQVCCVWDGPNGSVRRRSIFKEYKEGRRPSKNKNRFYEWGQESNSAYQQLGLIKILGCLPVRQFSVADCEADDVIAALVRYYTAECNVVVMSTDKDYLQLVGEHVAVYNPVKHKFITPAKVVEQYGVHPENFVVARAAIGDESDNIDGIKGVGFKTLVKYFPQLAQPGVTLNTLYESAKSMERKPKVVLNLLANYDIMERNYRLMQLDLPVLTRAQSDEVHSTIEAIPAGDRATLRMYLLEYGLNYNCDALYTVFLKLLIAGKEYTVDVPRATGSGSQQ